MRLLLLLLTGCRAGDHDLLIDRAYWARRLPLTLTENGSANDFGRCGRRWGFDACKCYAPSLDTVEALSSSSLAWTDDASRLSAAITRLQSHCDEAVTVWMPVWGLGGSLIAHLDEYVIPAWMKGRAVVNTALGTAGGVPTVVVGTFAKDAFAQLYGPLAKTQADGMEPIVTAFLEGTL